jgi:hypothetical protein
MAETATEVREQAQEKAQEAKSKAADTARTQIDQRSTEFGDRAHSTAGDIRTVGHQLREQGKDQPARLADQAAGHVERVGSWLRDSDSDKLLSDVEDFGRRKPWAFAVGGLALGIAASRFLKASSTQRYEQRQQSQGFDPTGSGNGHGTFEPGSHRAAAPQVSSPAITEPRPGIASPTTSPGVAETPIAPPQTGLTQGR